MSYAKITDYAAKDGLVTGNPSKIVRGTELGAEFDAIATADALNVKTTALGTGVQTFLATPSSANLLAAITDETGTGALVFANSPTLVTPALGTPSALVGTNITGTAAGLTAGNATLTATVTVVDAAADTTTWPMLATSITGNMTPATDAGLTYNASTNEIAAGGYTANSLVTVSVASVNGYLQRDKVGFADSAQTADNRIADFNWGSGVFSGRFLSDVYGSPQTWVSVAGGAGLGITSITFGGANGITAQKLTSTSGTIVFPTSGYINNNHVVWGAIYRPSQDGSSASHLWTNASGAAAMYLSSTGLLTLSAGLSATQVTSTVATGTAPLVVSSTTEVANLKAATATTATNQSGGTVAATTISASGLITATGGQIAFPATQVPSANVNTLDDYEEGTWTPTLTFATPGDLSVGYIVNEGSYTKIGRLVTLQFRVETSSFTHTTASGNLTITGLPFAVTTPYPYSSIAWNGITKANYTQISSFASGNTLTFYASGSGQTISAVTATNTPTGGSMILNGTIVHTV